MKNVIVTALVAVSAVGCGRVDNVFGSVKSYTGLLERKVTLYNAQGQEIKSWVTDNEIQYVGPVAGFITKDGTNVRVSGTFIVEGK